MQTQNFCMNPCYVFSVNKRACPDDQLLAFGQCFSYTYIADPTLDWTSAEQHCIDNYGGHLASIKSDRILQVFRGLLAGKIDRQLFHVN